VLTRGGRFARRSDLGFQDEITISNYLANRAAFTIARITLPPPINDDNGEEEINRYIELYDKMTSFYWPSEWTSLVCAFFY
jgi:hypothetical protein